MHICSQNTVARTRDVQFCDRSEILGGHEINSFPIIQASVSVAGVCPCFSDVHGLLVINLFVSNLFVSLSNSFSVKYYDCTKCGQRTRPAAHAKTHTELNRDEVRVHTEEMRSNPVDGAVGGRVFRGTSRNTKKCDISELTGPVSEWFG